MFVFMLLVPLLVITSALPPPHSMERDSLQTQAPSKVKRSPNELDVRTSNDQRGIEEYPHHVLVKRDTGVHSRHGKGQKNKIFNTESKLAGNQQVVRDKYGALSDCDEISESSSSEFQDTKDYSNRYKNFLVDFKRWLNIKTSSRNSLNTKEAILHFQNFLDLAYSIDFEGDLNNYQSKDARALLRYLKDWQKHERYEGTYNRKFYYTIKEFLHFIRSGERVVNTNDHMNTGNIDLVQGNHLHSRNAIVESEVKKDIHHKSSGRPQVEVALQVDVNVEGGKTEYIMKSACKCCKEPCPENTHDTHGKLHPKEDKTAKSKHDTHEKLHPKEDKTAKSKHDTHGKLHPKEDKTAKSKKPVMGAVGAAGAAHHTAASVGTFAGHTTGPAHEINTDPTEQHKSIVVTTTKPTHVTKTAKTEAPTTPKLDQGTLHKYDGPKLSIVEEFINEARSGKVDNFDDVKKKYKSAGTLLMGYLKYAKDHKKNEPLSVNGFVRWYVSPDARPVVDEYHHGLVRSKRDRMDVPYHHPTTHKPQRTRRHIGNNKREELSRHGRSINNIMNAQYLRHGRSLSFLQK